jgi:HEAT repeat protein
LRWIPQSGAIININRKYPEQPMIHDKHSRFITGCLLFLLLYPGFIHAEKKSEFPQINELMSRVSLYDYGPDRTALAELDSLINLSLDDLSFKSRLERLILEQLMSDLPMGAVAYYSEKLCLIGSEKAIPVLADLLKADPTFDMALYALTCLPSEKSDRLLRKSLTRFQGPKQIGIIQALADRLDNKALKQLHPLILADSALSRAALIAIGYISDKKSIPVLQKAESKIDSDLLPVLQESLIRCCRNESAEKRDFIVWNIMKNPGSDAVRSAAARAWILSNTARQEERIRILLNQQDYGIACEAIGMLREIVDTHPAIWADSLDNLSADLQICLLHVIADQQWLTAIPVVSEMLGSSDADVRSAALAALSKIGDGSCVMVLAEHAAAGNDQKVTRQVMVQLPADNVNAAMINGLQSADIPVSVELVKALGQRNTVEALNRVLPYCRHTDSRLRAAAFEAVGQIADPEAVPDLMNTFVQTRSETERRMIEKALVSISRRYPGFPITLEAIRPTLESIKDRQTKIALLELTGKIGQNDALPLLEGALKDREEAVRIAALRGLSSWPNAAPVETLFQIVQTSGEKQRILALRGILRLIERDETMSDSLKVIHYQRALTLNPPPSEITLLLSGLSRLEDMGALNLIEPFLIHEKFSSEAETAALAVLNTAWWEDEVKAVEILELLKTSDHISVIKSAERLMLQIR